MELRAFLRGKIVSYPAKSTFAIEQKAKGQPAQIVKHALSISQAIGLFHRLEHKKATTTKLLSINNGKFKTLMRS